MPRNKAAQVRLTETIAVLFIFFILVLFGIIFFYKYQTIALKQQQEELLGARAIDTTLKVLFMPELSCTKGSAEPEDNCFDLIKLKHANNTFKEYLTKYYFNIFSYSRIYVQEVYPNQEEIILYDKEKPPREDGSQGWERKEPTFFVITLKDEIKGASLPHYGFGYLVVEVYS